MRLNQGTYTFLVVGVYHYEVTGMMATMTGDTSTSVFIPQTVAQQIAQSDTTGYYAAQIKASSQVTDMEAFAKQTEDYFNRHFYRSNNYCLLYTSRCV